MLLHRRASDAVLDCQNGIPFFTPWALPRGVPVLCVVHHVHDDQFGMYFPGWLARIGRFLEGPVARRAYRRHACVAVSPSTVTAMRERLAWTGPVYVVPNGVTLPHADAAGAEETDGDPELVCVSRLVPHKRVDRLLDVAERLRVRVHVIGRGPEEDALRAGIAARGLEDLVVLLGPDDPKTARPVVADSLRKVERDFGELRGHTSPTLTATEGPKVPATQRDILEPGWDRYSTVAAYTGIKGVTASASASDVTSPVQLDQPGALPYAAVDGDPWTRWESGGWTGPVGQWLRVDFDHPLTPRNVTATFVQDDGLGPPPDEIAVETETGRVVQHVARTSAAQPLRVPAGETRWLRIRILSLTARPAAPAAARVGISDLHVDGVHADREYRLPAVPSGGTVVMSRASDEMPACMRGSIRWVCSPLFERRGEEPYGFHRVFNAAGPGVTKLSGMATLTAPNLIQRYTGTDPHLKVTASSTLTKEPAGLPRSAFDADPATTWVPAAQDRAPWLSLSWDRKVRVGRITIRRPGGAAFLTQVRVEGDNGQWREVPLDDTGRVSFKPMRTSHLTLRFSGMVQVTEVTVPGVKPFRTPPGARVPLPCGYGPRLRLNGVDVPTRATGTYADLLQGRSIPFRACRTAKVKTGDDRLAQAPFDTFRIDSAALSPVGPKTAADESPPVTVTRWTSEHRQVEVSAQRASYLVVDENFNSGWQAKIDGRTLRPVRLDGWRQAWALPAGTVGTARLSYTPDRTYQASVLVGLNFLLILFIAALWPSRRRPAAPLREAERARSRAVAVLKLIVAVAAAAGIGYWTGGIVSPAVGAVAALLFAVVPSRLRLGSSWLPAAAMFAATVSLIVGLRLDSAQNPWGHFFAETLPQLLCMLVAARLVVALAHHSGQPQDAGRIGRST